MATMVYVIYDGDPDGPLDRLAQAIADGVLVDPTKATENQGQSLCQQAGFKVPVVITRAARAKTVEAPGICSPHADGQTGELKGGRSLNGRLWDLLWVLRSASGRASKHGPGPL